MTRMWMTDPTRLCRAHLLGEHKELHQLVGTIKAKRWSVLEGHAKLGQIETRSIRPRHTLLVKEMYNRGWRHRSPIPAFPKIDLGRIDVDKNVADLCERCSDCNLLWHPPVKPSAEEVWNKVKGVVHSTVRAFQRRYGGEYEELLSEAHVHFMKAYDTYNPNPSQNTGDYHIGGWVKYIVWNRLKDSLGTQLHRDWVLPRVENDFSGIAERNTFNLNQFLTEISQEAADVVKFALTNPYGSPYNKQLAVMRLLRDVGWAGQQILKAFNEIREALL